MNNEGLIGWMSGGEVAIIASSIQWRVKSAFITYRCPLCQQMLSRIRSHRVCLIAADSSWCTYLTNSLTAIQARTMANALHSCNAPPSKMKQCCHVFTLCCATFFLALLVCKRGWRCHGCRGFGSDIFGKNNVKRWQLEHFKGSNGHKTAS